MDIWRVCPLQSPSRIQGRTRYLTPPDPQNWLHADQRDHGPKSLSSPTSQREKRNKKDRYKNDNFTLRSSLNPWASCFNFRKSFYSHAHYHTNPPYPLLHSILKVEAQVCSMWPVQFIYFTEKKENMRPIHILFDILRKNSHFDEHKC